LPEFPSTFICQCRISHLWFSRCVSCWFKRKISQL